MDRNNSDPNLHMRPYDERICPCAVNQIVTEESENLRRTRPKIVIHQQPISITTKGHGDMHNLSNAIGVVVDAS
jgi:hypothetical protein